MNSRGRVLLLLLVLSFSLAAEEKERSADAVRISRLIDQLGHARFDRREEADRALRAIGTPALEALRKAITSKDVETRRRATRAVRWIEQQAATAHLLAAPRLRLNYRDTPLPVAVVDLARKTGLAIKLEGAERLAGRKITLDTGETTFWEAIDRFCATAGLIEKAPEPTEPQTPGIRGSSIVIIGGGRGIAPQPRDIMQPEDSPPPTGLILLEGKPVALPTRYAGAVRLRALPPETSMEGADRKEEEVAVFLEGTAGPQLLWKRAVALRIQRALDDQGQLLKPVAEPLPAAKPPDGGRRATIIINRIPITPSSVSETPEPRIPVRLLAGEKQSKTLKELSGTIVAQVQSPPETLVVVEKILKSVGQTVKGPRGGSLKVLEVDRQQDGEIRLRLQVEPPPTTLEDGPALQLTATVIIDGKRVGPREEPLSAANFALVDNKGKSMRVVKAVETGVRAGLAREVELTYQPEKGQGTPARFVYTGRRGALVEVPFVLENVPVR